MQYTVELSGQISLNATEETINDVVLSVIEGDNDHYCLSWNVVDKKVIVAFRPVTEEERENLAVLRKFMGEK